MPAAPDEPLASPQRAKRRRGRGALPVATAFFPRAPDVAVEDVATDAQRNVFARLPELIYKGDPNFVPPVYAERRDFIDPLKNPFFRHARGAFFIARRNGQPVGRVAAVNDARYNQFHHTDVAFFGLFECVNDPAVASALFEEAARWARATGPRVMIGPVNLAFHHDGGMLVEGFDRTPSMFMPYNPRYYPRLLEANGFTKLHDLWAYEMLGTQRLPDKFLRTAERLRDEGQVRIRRIDLRDPEGEGKRIKAIYEEMLQPGWGTYPFSDSEFSEAVTRLRPILTLRPELCLVAESDGEAVAFSITIPDTNVAQKAAGGYLSRFGLPIGLAKMMWAARKIDRLRVLLFGIRAGWRRRGLEALLIDETMREAIRLGYRSGEVGWVAEDDRLINRTILSTGAKRVKVFRLYERAI
jgi:GNAT superfamily N-acetyltransferase